MNNWEIIFRNSYPLWAVAGAFAAVSVFVIWQYRLNTSGLTARRKVFLTILHITALALVFTVFLQPVFITISAEEKNEGFTVLLDESKSMELPSTEGRNRMEDLNRILASPAVARLPDMFEVEIAAFSSDVRDVSDEDKELSVAESGNSTDISSALKKAAAAGPTDILLISDGCWNTGADPRRQAVSLAGRGVKVHSVAPSALEYPDDISVQDVRCSSTVFLGDSISLQLKVVHSGFTGRKVDVEVIREGRKTASKQLTLGASMLAQAVSIIMVPEEPGRYVYRVGVPVQEGEAVPDNNYEAFSVDVVEKRLRILVAENEPRWEYRFLRNALERDPSSDIDSILFRPGVGPMQGTGYLSRFPTDKKDLGRYDVVILGDLGGEAVTSAAADNISEFVRAVGGGLIILPGRKNGLSASEGTSMEDILPVEILPGPPGVQSRSPSSLELTVEGREHLITRLTSTRSGSIEAWDMVSGGAWYASCGDARRGTRVLVQHPFLRTDRGPLPVLAVRQAGNGKVVYLGSDCTWRWRKAVGDKYHYRFWAQLVRWIVKKQFEGDDPYVKLACERNVCEVGEKIFVEAYVLGTDFYPLDDAEVYLLLSGSEGAERSRVRMEASGSGWGIYRTAITLTQEGDQKLQVVVPHHGTEPLGTSVELTVERPALEAKALVPDTSSLKQIADITGGEYIPSNDISGFVDRLQKRKHARVRTAEMPLWDSPWLVILATVLLAVEWIFRKRWGLS